MAEKTISVGKLGKPHGISGAFRFLLDRPFKNKKKATPYFLIENKGAMTPFFIVSIEWLGLSDGFIQFEEVKSPEEARRYSGTTLYLYEKDCQALFAKNQDQIGFLVGYTIIDEQLGEVGTISELFDNPAQLLASVTKLDGGEVMIPLPDEFIVDINKKKKELTVDLPEGLLEI